MLVSPPPDPPVPAVGEARSPGAASASAFSAADSERSEVADSVFAEPNEPSALDAPAMCCFSAVIHCCASSAEFASISISFCPLADWMKICRSLFRRSSFASIKKRSP
eukprot:scaffold857_cov152-Ochromonas_danica.AAC.11